MRNVSRASTVHAAQFLLKQESLSIFIVCQLHLLEGVANLCATHDPFANKTSHISHTMSTNPWAKRDAWRYEGQFSRWNRFRSAFPGLGIALGAFALYLVYDKVIKKEEHGHGHH